MPVTKEEGAKAGQSQFPQPEPFSKARGREVEQSGSKLPGRDQSIRCPKDGGGGKAWGVKRTGGQAVFYFPSFSRHWLQSAATTDC